jgi:hypothetical protein
MALQFPQQRLAVAVLCNNGSANASQLAQRVAEVYLGPEMTPVAARAAAAAPSSTATPSDTELAKHAGIYWDEQSEARLTIVHAPGTLSVVGFGPAIELRHVEGTRFEAPSVGMTLTFDDRRVLVASGDARPVAYELIVPKAPAPAELSTLAGRYVSDEADATVEVRVRDGKLELSGRRLQPIPLEHLFADTYAGGPAVVRFVRTGRAVRGLSISNGRSRGVPFERGNP